MKKYAVIAFFASLALGLGSASLVSQEDPKEKLMQVKSQYAHRLLDAVIQEDFDTIQDQAFRLKTVAETADWKVLGTPEYIRESDAFIAAASRLSEAGKNRNSDSAALAFMDLTLKCVHCHRYLRSHE